MRIYNNNLLGKKTPILVNDDEQQFLNIKKLL